VRAIEEIFGRVRDPRFHAVVRRIAACRRSCTSHGFEPLDVSHAMAPCDPRVRLGEASPGFWGRVRGGNGNVRICSKAFPSEVEVTQS